MVSSRLEADLRAHHRRLMNSVERGLSTADDERLLTRALAALPSIVGDLELGAYRGEVVADHKPRLLLRFGRGELRLSASGCIDVVLKVYGETGRAEGPLQHRWHDAGLPVPSLAFGERAECNWLALEHLSMWPVAPDSPGSRVAVTRQVAAVASLAHDARFSEGLVLRSLDRVIVGRLNRCVNSLREAGFSVRELGDRAMDVYSTTDRFPLHGDLALDNIGCVDGKLIVFDASALVGDRSLDAARWCARTSNEEIGPVELLDCWLDVETVLDAKMARLMLAAECLLEAGSRVLMGIEGYRRFPPSLSTVPQLVTLTRRLLGAA
jgi:hypothetical protein